MKNLANLLNKSKPTIEEGFLYASGKKDELEEAYNDIKLAGYKKEKTIESESEDECVLAIELSSEAWEGNSPFHESMEALWSKIKSDAKVPENYFVLEEIAYSTEDKKEERIKPIQYYLEWRNLLETLKDHKGSEGDDSTLIYFISTEKGAKLYEVNPKKISYSELKTITFKEIFEDDLSQLKTAISLEDGHQKERRDVLRASLAELMEENVSIYWLIKQGNRLKKKYKENHDIYLHKFSVNKLLVEIEEKSADYISKINDSISSSQAKAFAIPGAVIAVAALVRNADLASSILIIFGLLSVWIITKIANNIHREAYQALADQIKRSLGRYEVIKDESLVRVSAENAKEKLLSLIDKAQQRLTFLNDLALGVFITGIIYTISKSEKAIDTLEVVLKFFWSFIQEVSSNGALHRWHQVIEFLSAVR